jgi:hypothetical protein
MHVTGTCGVCSYTALLSGEPSQEIDTTTLLIFAAILFALMVLLMFLGYRYREQCENMLKRFLVVDILIIYCLGSGYMLLVLAQEFVIPFDLITYFMLVWNFGALGLFSLYFKVVPSVHRFYLVVLNAVMAIMMIVTLEPWILFIILFLASLGDIISEARPNARILSPFILPSNVELWYETPRILYQVGGLRLRAADLMWYGLMMGLLDNSVVSYLTAYVAILTGLVFVVFVLPFFGKTYRPLPVAFFLLMLAIVFDKDYSLPFLMDMNFLKTAPMLAY